MSALAAPPTPAVRAITRELAIDALHEAAATAGVRAAELTPAHYRAYRVRHTGAGRPPSHLAIALLFGGWRRACVEAART